ncbi:hypothetical protein HZB74_01495 [Candidatus Saccharibacteria bacterium]|nr:hypothetical protein [Candidatus Saccharibacteria bacterium]
MNGFNPEAPGFGEIKTGRPLSDHELAQAAVIDFFGPDSRYPGHNKRMLQMLEEFDFATPGLCMATELHDIVDHGLVNPDDEETKQRAQTIIADLYEQVSDKHEFLYGLGCAISTASWESDVAEVYRTADRSQFPPMDDNSWTHVRAAIKKDSSVEIDEAILKAARVVHLDTSSLRKAMTDYDVEGLLLKSVELLANLESPPPNPDSVYRDCIEIRNCYGPALELFGFNELATKLNGEALKYFYDDPEGIEKTNRQIEVSLRHLEEIHDKVPEVVSNIIEEVGEYEDIENLRSNIILLGPRVKSEGSMRKKFSTKKYKDEDQLPDGIGYKVIILDNFLDKSEDEIGELIERIGKALQERLSPSENNNGYGIFASDDSSTENYIRDPKPSGYKAFHFTPTYMAGTKSVPVEIQVVSSTQDIKHTFDKASWVLYKNEAEANEYVMRDLHAIGSREGQLRNKPNNQELRPQTWFELLKLMPEMDTPIHKTFEVVEINGSRIMVADGMGKYAKQLLGEAQGLGGDIILPPSVISEKDFMAMIRLISPELAEDESVLKALEFVKNQALKPRRDGIPTPEGHLLPVALHAAIMASLSSVHWESRDSIEYLSDTVLVALLHDMAEDVEGDEAKQQMRDYIGSECGPKVLAAVDALTSPQEIENETRRRKAYARQLAKNPLALLIKLSDRSQNHVSDIVRLARTNPDKDEMGKIKKYYIKTITYLNDNFMNRAKQPEEYVQVYKTVMRMLQSALNI